MPFHSQPVRHADDARLERAITRLLAPIPQPTQRPKAIFRVVPAGARFAFTRTLIGSGAGNGGPSVERHGPFETERAAHALAKRAAARLAAEEPQLVVGVVGLDDAERPKLPADRSFSAEDVPADPRLSMTPTCETCGKPTYYRCGRPVRFCPKQPGEKRSACNTLHTNWVFQERIKRDPELKKRKRARDAQLRRESPHRWESHLARNRALRARHKRQRGPSKRAEPLPTGSVLATASPRAEGFDLLTRLYAAVPASLPRSLRMEIISETAVLVLDGAEISVAVAQASKNVRRAESRLRYAKPIEDCFWLADETQTYSEAY